MPIRTSRKFALVAPAALALLTAAAARAQQESARAIYADVPVPQPANAVALAGAVAAPNVEFAGGATVPISLHTFREGAVELPIALTNRIAGIRVADVPTWVGSGWSLSAGGMITRSVKGSPDEGGYALRNTGFGESVGFLGGGTAYGRELDSLNERLFAYLRECEGYSAWDPCHAYDSPPPPEAGSPRCRARAAEFATTSWIQRRQELGRALAQGVYDTESDVYFFRVAGYAGSFRFDEAGVPRQAEASDLRIEYGDGLAYFKLTDPRGVVYYFGRDPEGTVADAYDASYTASAAGTADPRANDALRTGWHLVRAVDPNSDADVRLTYRRTIYAEYAIGTPSTSLVPSQRWPGACPDYTLTVFREMLPARIRGRHHEVEFVAGSAREDLKQADDAEGGFARPSGFWHPLQGEPHEPSVALGGLAVYTRHADGLRRSLAQRYVLGYDYAVAPQAPRRVCGNDFSAYEFESAATAPDRKRLQLRTIDRVDVDVAGGMGVDGAPRERLYDFAYYGDDSSGERLPSRLSNGYDHWGFANGRGRNPGVYPDLEAIALATGQGGEPMPNTPSGTAYLADRSSGPEAVNGSLRAVTAPGGAVTRYELEAHAYPSTREVVGRTGFHPFKICAPDNLGRCCENAPSDQTDVFTVEPVNVADPRNALAVTELSVTVTGLTGDWGDCANRDDIYLTIDLLDAAGERVRSTELAARELRVNGRGKTRRYNFVIGSTGNDRTNTIHPGAYGERHATHSAFHSVPPGDYSVRVTRQGSDAMAFVQGDVHQFGTREVTETRYVGGARLRSVERESGDRSEVTTYDYGAGATTLQVYDFPRYVSMRAGVAEDNAYLPCSPAAAQGPTTVQGDGLVWHSTSVIPLASVGGSHVGYREITASTPGAGSVLTEFEVLRNGTSPAAERLTYFTRAMPYARQRQYNPLLGQRRRRVSLDEDGVAVAAESWEREATGAGTLSYRTAQIRWIATGAAGTNGQTPQARIEERVARGTTTWNTYDVKLARTESRVGDFVTVAEYGYRDDRAHHNPVRVQTDAGGLTSTRWTSYVADVPESAAGLGEHDAAVLREMERRHMVGLPLRRRDEGPVVGGWDQTYTLQHGHVLPHSRYVLRRSALTRTRELTYDAGADHRPDRVWERAEPLPLEIAYHDDGYEAGLPATHTRGRRVRVSAYDARRRLASVRTADGQRTDYGYDGYARLTGVDVYGVGDTPFRATATAYDRDRDAGRLTVTETTSYPPGADGASVADQVIRTRYDGFGLPTEVRRVGYRADGGDLVAASHTYDALGRRETTTTPQAGTTVFTYEANPLGRPKGEIRVDGSEIRYEYEERADARATLTRDPNGVWSSVETDGLGRTVATIQDARGGEPLVTAYAYEPWGGLDAVVSPGGKGTTYDYDASGRLVAKRVPGQDAPERYAYDAHDRLEETVTPNGARRSYTYTDYNEPETEAVDGVEQVRYRYPVGTERGLAHVGRPFLLESRMQDGTGITRTYYHKYDAFGRVKRERRLVPFASANEAYAYTYHPAGAVAEVTQTFRHTGGDVTVTDRTLFDDGLRPRERRQAITFAGSTREKVVSQRTYNANDQLERLRLSVQGDRALQDVDYRYDERGRLVGVNEVNPSRGVPLLACAVVERCVGCAVGASELALAEAADATLAADVEVVDLRTGGGESLPLDYPYPFRELDRAWADARRVTEADPATAGGMRRRSPEGAMRFESSVPLDYLELYDRATETRFRLPFDVYGPDGACVRCHDDDELRDDRGRIRLGRVLRHARQVAAQQRRGRYLGGERGPDAATRLAALGYGLPTDAPARGPLTASWWRDSLPADPGHGLHAVSLAARFTPRRLARAGGGTLELRVGYDVVSDTGATQRQELVRQVPVALGELGGLGERGGAALPDDVYEVAVRVDDLWAFPAEGDDPGGVALAMTQRLAVALDTATLELAGVGLGAATALAVAPALRELYVGTVAEGDALSALGGLASAPADGPATALSASAVPIPSVMPDAFAYALTYDGSTVTGAPARRDGSVAEVTWQSYGRRAQAYGYDYDRYGRLDRARHADYQGSGWHLGDRYGADYEYDADGNLTYLKREGVLTTPIPGDEECFGVIDGLSYGYGEGRLVSVNDWSGHDAGRVAGSGSLSYSAAGELVGDESRGLEVGYDPYGLPRRLSLPGGVVEVGYDAGGRKRSQVTRVEGGATETVQYFGSVEVRDGRAYAVANAHGRALLNPADGTWDYEFALRDHLGSTRVVLADRYFDERDVRRVRVPVEAPCRTGDCDEAGTASGASLAGPVPGGPVGPTPGPEWTYRYDPILRVREVHDYYPFGLRHTTQAEARGEDYRYEFGGKERVGQQIGLDWQDFAARWYDPALGRFTTTDPLASEFPAWTPYHYTHNDPINLVDPTGMSAASPDDIILRGANNSSVTIETDLIDVEVDASAFVGDLGGNYTIGGTDAVVTGLDIVGVVDPTPVSDGLSAALSVGEGNYLDAAASVLGAAVPLVGDVAKVPKIAKGVKKITEAIGDAKGGAKGFDDARREAFSSAGMTDPSKVSFSKVDPQTGTVTEFKGPGGAKIGYDGPHPGTPGPHHDTQHISWQSAGKRGAGGAQRGNIPYSGPRHPSRPERKP